MRFLWRKSGICGEKVKKAGEFFFIFIRIHGAFMTSQTVCRDPTPTPHLRPPEPVWLPLVKYNFRASARCSTFAGPHPSRPNIGDKQKQATQHVYLSSERLGSQISAGLEVADVGSKWRPPRLHQREPPLLELLTSHTKDLVAFTSMTCWTVCRAPFFSRTPAGYSGNLGGPFPQRKGHWAKDEPERRWPVIS
jgi:hypothetical protein